MKIRKTNTTATIYVYGLFGRPQQTAKIVNLYEVVDSNGYVIRRRDIRPYLTNRKQARACIAQIKAGAK